LFYHIILGESLHHCSKSTAIDLYSINSEEIKNLIKDYFDIIAKKYERKINKFTCKSAIYMPQEFEFSMIQ
jgi:hypothetical protein